MFPFLLFQIILILNQFWIIMENVGIYVKFLIPTPKMVCEGKTEEDTILRQFLSSVSNQNFIYR